MPSDHQKQVYDFMRTMDQEVPPRPRSPKLKIQKFRAELISEEFDEFINAVHDPEHKAKLAADRLEETLDKLVPVADAIADLLYVVYGATIAYGIDIHPIFDIVHAANMTKVNGPMRADGKRLKPPDWRAPEPAIREELRRQLFEPPSYAEITDNGRHIHGVEWEGEVGH